MIKLSYTTMNDLVRSPHSWLNKQMGVEKQYPEHIEEAFRKGKELHRLIQDHVADIKPDKRVGAFLERKFPIVEVEEKDPRCEFFYKVNDKYALYGYFDGWNPETKTLLEIKSGTTLWTTGKFAKSIQRKLNALGTPNAVESLLVSVHSDIDLWERVLPKKVLIPITEKDRADALEFVNDAIKIIEGGDFTSDLVDGKCVDYNCPYGRNCRFK